MKKAFTIYVDDDAEMIGFCGTVITKRIGEDEKGITCVNFHEKENFGDNAELVFPSSG